MNVTKQMRKILSSKTRGVFMTIMDFNVKADNQPALIKALSRAVAQGELRRFSKGKYYKPKETRFGILNPTSSELVKDLLEKNGKTIGYISGTEAFASMGLTTQISSAIVIGTNKYRRPIMRGGYKVSFLLQPNIITEKNVALLRILDAIRLIREIPATSPDNLVISINELLKTLSIAKQKELCNLARNYTPYVRALLGAMMENAGLNNTYGLRKGLNSITNYKLPISERVLPNKKNWNII